MTLVPKIYSACIGSLFVCVFVLLPFGNSMQIARASQAVVLDGAGTGRTFDGIGAVSAGASSRLLIDYPEPYRSRILDYLFLPNYGANLQILKVEIGADVNSTDGSEPSHMRSATDENYTRGYEWWLMQQAKLRNPDIELHALEWGAPGWIGGGQFFSQDNIDYIVNFIENASDSHGLTIDYVGIWNESTYDTTWIKNLKTAIQAAGLSTKIVAADLTANHWNIVANMNADPDLMAAISAVGAHYVGYSSTAAAQAVGKPLWESESGPWRGDWTGAKSLAKTYNRNYIVGKMTSAQVWNPVTSYYDSLPLPRAGLMEANTPWSGYFSVLPAIWATAHTTQFAEPGWQYIDSGSGELDGDGSFVTLKNGSDYSVVIETIDATASQMMEFDIAGGLSSDTVHVWKSDSNAQFIQQGDIVPVGNAFTITLSPGSIYTLTTLTGQAKGSVGAGDQDTFPFPYDEDFESYSAGMTPQYFSDMTGAHETASCAGGRAGTCFRQVITTSPIRWPGAGATEPASFVGANTWTDYQVSADVLLEQAGNAKLIGRLNSQLQVSGNMRAYQLYVSDTGAWSLRSGNTTVLASGTVAFSLNTWHNLKMAFNGSEIKAYIDDVLVATVTNTVNGAGMAGVGVRTFTNAQFDNFLVEPLDDASTHLEIPQWEMSASATSAATDFEASRTIDGNVVRMWHASFACTPSCAPTAPLPQSVTLDLGGAYNVDRVRYLPRQDGGLTGAFTSYTIYTSTDGSLFTQVATGSWASNASEKIVNFTPTAATHIRVEAIAATGNYASAAEINIGYDSVVATPTPTPTPSVGSGGGGGGSGSFISVSSPVPSASSSPAPLASPAPVEVGFFSSASGLIEGDRIMAPPHFDVYGINAWGYKRLFISPAIFDFYGLDFSEIKFLTSLAAENFPTSGLFRNCEENRPEVYAFEAVGEDGGLLHHVQISGEAAATQDPNFFKKVFCINSREFAWYPLSSQTYTSLDQLPVYQR